MSQLIEMRRRIKAIDTTQKITHAMQLVAMSTRTRLRERAFYLEQFQRDIAELRSKVTQAKAGEGVSETRNPLLIVIGAQKGLCGTFNTNLLLAATRELKQLTWHHATVIVLGKKFKDYMSALIGAMPFAATISFGADVTAPSIESVAAQLIATMRGYDEVRILSTHPSGFFVQKQLLTQIDSTPVPKEADEVVHKLTDMHLQTTMQNLILQSLLAEQAARFISMDSATRNAKSLKAAMVLQFNKLRQWKITKELIELSSSF